MSDEHSNHSVRKETNHPTPQISTLERREIQAPLMACLIDGFIRELGHEPAMRVASTAIQADAREAGKTIARKFGRNTTRELMRVVRQVWAEDDALVYDILEETDQMLSFNVTRCRYVEMYERLGLKEFGYCLSCNRDEPLINGFNPHMKLIRTHTIMQGAQICDFRIIVEEK
jgi:predicted hydrocarbon binding protein